GRPDVHGDVGGGAGTGVRGHRLLRWLHDRGAGGHRPVGRVRRPGRARDRRRVGVPARSAALGAPTHWAYPVGRAESGEGPCRSTWARADGTTGTGVACSIPPRFRSAPGSPTTPSGSPPSSSTTASTDCLRTRRLPDGATRCPRT